jgi:exonuclease 3'-5' domain-containing protein 1
MQRPHVVCELSPEVEAAFADVRIVALDVEGMDLSRIGSISYCLCMHSTSSDTRTGAHAGKCCLVQLAVPADGEDAQCFLFDVLDKPKQDPMICFLRGILESDSVLKIIHDCRMDSDALHHLLDITLTNVHDTSSWHGKLTGSCDVNLNDLLQGNGLKPNIVRDCGIYESNPAFWTIRPLTEKMITWAAGDVALMFKVHARQVAKASPDIAIKSINLSNEFLDMARSADISWFKVRVNVGRFIGSRGCNLRALQRSTNTLIYSRGKRSAAEFIVYYKDVASLQQVKQCAGDV